MAQKQKAPRQAKDPYAQRSKELTSSVQRLRGWVGSDPSRLPELGDALVALTAHRLRGHEFAAAGSDAQDAVKQAAQLLTAPGPIGAYTEVADATRYVTAVVHLASVQAGLGLAELAGRTLASLDELIEQFTALRLELTLEPELVVRALACTARSALSTGDVATAGATADAALRRLVAAGLQDDPDTAFLALDVDQVVADTRWAADRPADSLTHLHRARDRWAAVVDGRLDAPAGLSPSLVSRLAAPAPALHRDLADRLVATGEVDLGLVTRRDLVGLLQRLAGRLGAPAERQLALVLADLAADLLTAGRTEEAHEVSADAMAAMGVAPDVTWPVVVRAWVLTHANRSTEAVTLLRSRPLPSEPQALGGLVQQALAQAYRASGEEAAAAEAEAALEALVQQLNLDAPDRLVDRARGVVGRGRVPVSWSAPDSTVWDRLAPAAVPEAAAVQVADEDASDWLAAERAEAHRREEERSALARAEATRREQQEREQLRLAAEEEERERARRIAEQEAEEARRAATEEAERQETKRRREERLVAYRLEAERRAAEQAAAEAATGPSELSPEASELEPGLEAEPDAEVELEVQPEPEPEVEVEVQVESEVEVEPTPAPGVVREQVVEPQPQPIPEPVLTAGPQPAQYPDPAPEAVPTPEPVLDALDLARQSWQQARAGRDRRATRAAAEQLAELLRPLMPEEPGTYRPLLQQVLSELAGLRMRSGDLRGARAASREAKELARDSGR